MSVRRDSCLAVAPATLATWRCRRRAAERGSRPSWRVRRHVAASATLCRRLLVSSRYNISPAGPLPTCPHAPAFRTVSRPQTRSRCRTCSHVHRACLRARCLRAVCRWPAASCANPSPRPELDRAPRRLLLHPLPENTCVFVGSPQALLHSERAVSALSAVLRARPVVLSQIFFPVLTFFGGAGRPLLPSAPSPLPFVAAGEARGLCYY